jgi:cephalosporin hydroxylase
MTFGSFIEPDAAVERVGNLAEALGVPVVSGYRAMSAVEHLLGQNRIFDRIVTKIKALDFTYEDQCSAQYYFDLVRTMRDFNGQFDRVVEVGVYLGGSTSFFAGCIEPFDYDLDMIDIRPDFLRFAYERVRRMYPESAKRIRLFHGDLATYVRRVMIAEPSRRYLVHHDGAHNFDQVVVDMASLYYARNSIHAVIAQDTHLRGTIANMNFVDLALQAVFGSDLNFAPIGSVYGEHDHVTAPNMYEGNYFLPNVSEGMVLPMAVNRFRYPHPSVNVDFFLPPE